MNSRSGHVLCVAIILSFLSLNAQITKRKVTAEEFGITNPPKTARQVNCFKSFNNNSVTRDVVRKCGIPDEDVGSGFTIYIYHMTDGSTVGVKAVGAHLVEITHVQKTGKSTTLMCHNC